MADKIKKKKVVLIVFLIIFTLFIAYVILWNCLYHFRWKKHITESLSLNSTYENEYCDTYEAFDGFDNYNLQVPKFPYLTLYGGMASGQSYDDNGIWSNPSGLNIDIVNIFYFDILSGKVSEYLFTVSSFIETERYPANQSYSLNLDANGKLLNENELEDEAVALYHEYADELYEIIVNEKQYFKIN